MQVIEVQCASILLPHDHLHINQMSMPEPVRPNTAQTATPRLAGGQMAQKQHAARPRWTNHAGERGT